MKAERKTNRELREKANSLPASPGVYIMYGAGGKIIYIGKSKALHFRVSQYFQDTEKNVKTAKMVSEVYDFDYMLTETEIEALVLENKLIKLHQPRYNIRLKDAKNYPYIKVTVNEEYPQVTVTRKRAADGAKYFGPYSGIGVAWGIVKTLQKTFALPSCKLTFPRDIGKSRPCLYNHIGQCVAPCSGNVGSEEYREIFTGVLSFLKGSFSDARASLEEKMKFASANLMFESAALYRDRIKSLDSLWQKQNVVGAPDDEYDIISLYTGDTCSCLASYYVRSGAVIDSDNFIFTADQIVDENAIVSFLADIYQRREYVPKTLLIGFPLSGESSLLLGRYIAENAGHKTELKFPQKGRFRELCDMVEQNAALHAKQFTEESEKDSDTLIRLAELAGLEVVPENIESVDISNYGNDNITAGLISVVNGRFNKSGYRVYKIRSTSVQDDYASMREALERRLSHADENPLPDLFLLDGGKGHVSTIKALFEEKGIDVPVLGMVKDEFHKTRALTDGENEISIAREQSVFVFLYRIQEEVHRFSISRMKSAKSKTLKHSVLEKIDGIGQKKAMLLLAKFGTVTAVKNASEEELAAVKGISAENAGTIYKYYHGESEDKE